jgi:DNA/RNA-binding domain of Phe-tRNA-synthetase-like protein
MLSIAPHPLLDLASFTADLPRPLGELPSPPALLALLRADAPAPLQRSEDVRQAVRDLLRHGGFKPTGRSKPASEYLVRAAEEGSLSSINLVVDACNAVSLHSSLPISVVDLDLAKPPLSVAVAAPGVRYVFNPSGQEIDVEGLLSLHDADGPCAGPVKDAQRTKTHAGTRRILALVWGTNAAPGLAARAARWYRELLEASGATTEG